MKTELKAWRRKRRISQSQAALVLGVPLRTLQSWESGARTPGPLATETLRSRMDSIDTGHALRKRTEARLRRR